MDNNISVELRRAVVERAYRLCEYCLVHEDDLFHPCEVDHVISIKHGGQTVLQNLAYACFHCNRHKGSDIGSLIPASGRLVRFFHPRTDHWSDHFYIISGRIESSSSIGEATSRILEFNQFDRVVFRKLLTDSGRYPTVEALARINE